VYVCAFPNNITECYQGKKFDKKKYAGLFDTIYEAFMYDLAQIPSTRYARGTTNLANQTPAVYGIHYNQITKRIHIQKKTLC